LGAAREPGGGRGRPSRTPPMGTSFEVRWKKSLSGRRGVKKLACMPSKRAGSGTGKPQKNYRGPTNAQPDLGQNTNDKTKVQYYLRSKTKSSHLKTFLSRKEKGRLRIK